MLVFNMLLMLICYLICYQNVLELFHASHEVLCCILLKLCLLNVTFIWNYIVSALCFTV